MTRKPDILYRLSRDHLHLFLRVPDNDTEKDGILMFNRLMADLGFPNPKEIFNERLGVAVVPSTISYREKNRLVRLDVLTEIKNVFTALPIPNRDWYTKRF